MARRAVIAGGARAAVEVVAGSMGDPPVNVVVQTARGEVIDCMSALMRNRIIFIGGAPPIETKQRKQQNPHMQNPHMHHTLTADCFAGVACMSTMTTPPLCVAPQPLLQCVAWSEIEYPPHLTCTVEAHSFFGGEGLLTLIALHTKH